MTIPDPSLPCVVNSGGKEPEVGALQLFEHPEALACLSMHELGLSETYFLHSFCCAKNETQSARQNWSSWAHRVCVVHKFPPSLLTLKLLSFAVHQP